MTGSKHGHGIIAVVIVMQTASLAGGCAPSGPSQFEIDSNACPALPASDADPDAFLAAYNAQKQCMDRAEAAEQRREDREDAAWSALGGVGAGLQNTGAAMMPNPSDYTLSTQPPSAPTPSPLPDLGYTVNQGDIRFGSPNGPLVGQTTSIGGPGDSPPPPVVIVPVPP